MITLFVMPWRFCGIEVVISALAEFGKYSLAALESYLARFH